MNFNLKIIINWLFLIFWMGLIFYLSSRPFLSSGFTPKEDFILRKIAHIGEFAILTFLFYRAFKNHKIFSNPIFWSAIFSIFYAVSDEAHQLFVPGRAGKAEDIIINGIGVLIAAGLVRREEKRFGKIPNYKPPRRTSQRGRQITNKTQLTNRDL
ncbi:VanZ family protein [Patescibacteria group bacterium]|nr:VanZ family protein [Patescibacteria group bacterium]MBU3999971.1 VanZ family protein [Patescibacteria group bacterium]MBU4056569.1 VanZ family protein [Patescibacteria group bacterium]MBU4368412.1 VanZ family protein [Patescibacteria group bacterium]